MKRLICAVLLLCLLCSAALALAEDDLIIEPVEDTAADTLPAEEAAPAATPAPAAATAAPATPAEPLTPVQLSSPDDVPETTEDGFLPAGSAPVYYKDHKGGRWLYVSSTERIDISRIQTKKPLLTYYVADIHVAPGNGMFIRSQYEDKPTKSNCRPTLIAQRDRIVYAQNGDFYTYRIRHKNVVGYVVRNGKILSDKTLKKPRMFVPNLDTLALYPDGRLEMNPALDKTAQQYLNDGATDVCAFGPILVQDGEIVITNHPNYLRREPRSCLGYVEQGHFIGLLVEGRRNHSKGANLPMVAKIMKELGCKQAINLDGGGSVAMLFMGESVQIGNRGGVANTVRDMPDVLCVGTY